ncbi:hypothetical protein ACNKHO_09475 [Shigella flexneri]
MVQRFGRQHGRDIMWQAISHLLVSNWVKVKLTRNELPGGIEIDAAWGLTLCRRCFPLSVMNVNYSPFLLPKPLA